MRRAMMRGEEERGCNRPSFKKARSTEAVSANEHVVVLDPPLPTLYGHMSRIQEMNFYYFLSTPFV